MDNADSAIPQAPAAVSRPGAQLQQARKDLQLAPEDVAQILHLSVKHINALERDDYQSLPGPTYVRGYLRGYAQLLGLAPEKLVETYNALIAPPKLPLTLPLPAALPQVANNDRFAKIATVAVAAVILGLVFLWWRGEGRLAESTPTPAVIAKQAPASVESTIPPEKLGPPNDNANVAPTPVPAAPESAQAPKVTPPSTTKPANSQTIVSGMNLNVSSNEPAKIVGPAPTTHTDRAIMRSRIGEVPPGATRSRLVLRAQQESWADVRDAHENKLLYENIPAGRSIAIEGVGPFNVFLGNADGVQVEFNGKNYDVSQHKRGQVARFMLGEAAPENN